jgi:hypothetical protein
MTITIDGGAGITFPDTVQQTNGMTNTGGAPKYYACRAWVSFDGSTTPPTIRSSANVASVTSSATGVYLVTFTTPMPNANYAAIVTGTARGGGGSPSSNWSIGFGSNSTNRVAGTYSTTAVQLYAQSSDGSGTGVNMPIVNLMVMA